jgi:PPOX class probable F420-dependent enzyme
MSMLPPAVRRQLASARVGHFATSDGRHPALIPVCFVLLGETVYHAIDAKPKSVPPSRLRRVANIRANPNAALLVDHYDEDWRRLWYVLVRGTARLLQGGAEHRRAVAALRRKYPQYRESVPLSPDALIIALDIAQVGEWVSAPRRNHDGRGHRPASRPGRTRRRM